MLRAGWSEDKVPLLAADRVVALTLGEGAPISEPLVGGPAGQGCQPQEGRGTQVASEMGYRIRVSGLDLSVYKWGGRGTNLHKGTRQFKGRIRLRF